MGGRKVCNLCLAGNARLIEETALKVADMSSESSECLTVEVDEKTEGNFDTKKIKPQMRKPEE